MNTAADPAPTRESIAAEAVICRTGPEGTEWLARWNPRWNCFHLVGGHKEPGETFRECVMREIEEELGIVRGTHFIAAEEPAAHMEFTEWSEGAKAWTRYTMELFAVRLFGQAAHDMIDARDDVRWLRRAEIEAGRCADGARVSPTMQRLLGETGWRAPTGMPTADEV